MKHLAVILFVAVTILTAGSGGSKYREKTAKKFYRPELFIKENSIPSAPSLQYQQPTPANPTVGVVIGSTDYDYGWGNGFPRRIAIDQANNVHFIFTEQNTSLTAPYNRSALMYGYYSRASGGLTTGYPRSKLIASSSAGAIDVFRLGAAAGIAVVIYRSGSDIRFAIDASPGAATFTESTLPPTLSANVSNPSVTIDQTAQTIWMTGVKNQNDIVIGKSTDFGTTWFPVDSLFRHLPIKGFTPSSAESPLIVSASGKYYYVLSLKGKGSLPPIGTAHPDSADRIGYFFSSDKGKSWSWTTVAIDGERLIVNKDTVYVLGENFSQFSVVVDEYDLMHMVMNGYCVKPIDDKTISTYFYMLYKKTIAVGWLPISNTSIAHIPDYDSSYYRFSGNAIGFAYPSLATNGSGTYLMAVWSQPILNPDKTLKLYNGYVQNEIYFSRNLRSTSKLDNSFGGLFANAAKMLSRNGSMYSIEFLYLADTLSANSVFSDGSKALVPWIYRTYGIIHDSNYPIIYATTSTGGTIEPSGFVAVFSGSSKKFTMTPLPGYILDSVLVNNSSVGRVAEYTIPNIDFDMTIHASFSKSTLKNDLNGELIPEKFSIAQNYPNPFNPSTTIRYEIPSRSAVTLTVFDALGREVQQLVKGEYEAGRYSVEWSAAAMPSGVYFYRITAGNYRSIKKMVLLK